MPLFTAAQAAQKRPGGEIRTGAQVHCRTGSSEKSRSRSSLRTGVHCRTGSSENSAGMGARQGLVHCRTGSSENTRDVHALGALVHCRTGSSESLDKMASAMQLRSLPHRQLRNLSPVQPAASRLFTAAQAAQKHMGQLLRAPLDVHCRTGSSEKVLGREECGEDVHCRTGSSERAARGGCDRGGVHCRTGSSEI